MSIEGIVEENFPMLLEDYKNYIYIPLGVPCLIPSIWIWVVIFFDIEFESSIFQIVSSLY